jgi:hypothetical protein
MASTALLSSYPPHNNPPPTLFTLDLDNILVTLSEEDAWRRKAESSSMLTRIDTRMIAHPENLPSSTTSDDQTQDITEINIARDNDDDDASLYSEHTHDDKPCVPSFSDPGHYEYTDTPSRAFRSVTSFVFYGIPVSLINITHVSPTASPPESMVRRRTSSQWPPALRDLHVSVVICAAWLPPSATSLHLSSRVSCRCACAFSYTLLSHVSSPMSDSAPPLASPQILHFEATTLESTARSLLDVNNAATSGCDRLTAPSSLPSTSTEASRSSRRLSHPSRPGRYTKHARPL